MKKPPNSKTNLERAIQRFAGNNLVANELRVLMANTIVAQMIGEGVVKGGSGLKFRYGELASRVTLDLDTSWNTSLDSFLKDIKSKLLVGWNGFDGIIIIQKQAMPNGIPFDYVMQPCDVKLNYQGVPWFTVKLEISHNEIGNADEIEMIPPSETIKKLFDYLCLPKPADVPAMKLEFQIAQKLHGCSAPKSKRAHDLIDLQLILKQECIDFVKTAEICRRLFVYRKTHSWPPKVIKGENWEQVYLSQKLDLPILSTVDEAIEWTNNLIHEIDVSL
jgi:hypothetical protein